MTLFLNAHRTLHRDSVCGNGDLYPRSLSTWGFTCRPRTRDIKVHSRLRRGTRKPDRWLWRMRCTTDGGALARPVCGSYGLCTRRLGDQSFGLGLALALRANDTTTSM